MGSFPYYTFRGSGVFASSGLHYFVHILATGYYHLYYLIVIMEFYVVFPLLLVLVRKYRRLHLPLFAAAVIWQVLYGVLVSTHDLGFNLSGTTQSRMVFSYAVYLIGGVIVAMHLSEVHDWICRHSRPILLWTLASIVLAELCSYVARYAWFPVYLRTGLNVFAPTSIPFNVGAILCIYLLGVHLTSPNRTVRTRAIVQSGADNSYGVYLSQMLWIPALVRLRDHFSLHLAWPIAVLIAVVIVYMVGYVFTALMARTPLARAVTGRGRAPLGTLWPFHPRGKSDLGGDIGNGPLELTSE